MTRFSMLALLAGCLRPYEAPDCADDEVRNSDDECVASGDGDSDTDSDSDSDSDADTGNDTNTLGDGDITVVVAWTSDGLDLNLKGTGRVFFGMAETSADGWLGEDCIPGNGDDPRAGGNDRCHDARIGENHWDSVGLDEFQNEVDTGGTSDNGTLFTDTIAAQGFIAYVLSSGGLTDRDKCWVWGGRGVVDYYADYDCIDISD